MFEAEGFYSVCKKAVKKLILPLVEEIKDHITNERITLMGQFDASNERLSKAVTDQLRQTAEALQRVLDSDAEKAELQAQVQAQVTALDELSTRLESDDPVPAPVEPAPPVEEPVPAPPVEEPFNPAPVEPDTGFDTNMPVVNEPVEPVLGEPAPGTEPAPAPVDEGSDTEVPDPNGPSASR